MKYLRTVVAAAIALALVSCVKEPAVQEEPGRVMILVSAGYNSLSAHLAADIEELSEGDIPIGTYRTSDVLLVLSRIATRSGDYNNESAPVLFRIYRDSEGQAVRDTLRRWSGDTPLSSKTTISEALAFIRERFPAKGYGMIMSSHGSGWLPEHYYFNNSSKALRSVGQDITGSSSVEMELSEFAEAIPMKMEYILFDACLMGGVEVAYALKDKADAVGFSQAEVLADGFNYSTLAGHLLKGSEPDPEAVCRDYFDQYDKSTSGRWATISLISTAGIESLASVCRELFEKYRSQIATLPGSLVQGYFRYGRHYFYDLKDILVNAGITQEEEESLQAALDGCIVYKAATPTFISFEINQYCGLSMYLPSMGNEALNTFYRENIDWNKATELVK